MNLLHEVGRGLDLQVDLPGQEVLQRRSAAAIGHDLEMRVCFLLKDGAGYVTEATSTSRPLRSLVRVCPQPSNQFRQVLTRHALPPHDHERLTDKGCNWLKILQQVPLERIESAGQNVRAYGPDAQRISVSGSARGPSGADA